MIPALLHLTVASNQIDPIREVFPPIFPKIGEVQR